jgi:hypothetical protein
MHVNGAWIVTQRKWGGGTTLTHEGSNTANMVVAWLGLKKDTLLFAAANAGTDEARKAEDEALSELLKLPQP